MYRNISLDDFALHPPQLGGSATKNRRPDVAKKERIDFRAVVRVPPFGPKAQLIWGSWKGPPLRSIFCHLDCCGAFLVPCCSPISKALPPNNRENMQVYCKLNQFGFFFPGDLGKSYGRFVSDDTSRPEGVSGTIHRVEVFEGCPAVPAPKRSVFLETSTAGNKAQNNSRPSRTTRADPTLFPPS